MSPLRSSASGRTRDWRRPSILFWLAAPLLLSLSALVRAVNHDESQYVAAIALIRHALPYRDFAYLQPPLQPLLMSPLSLLPAGWIIIGARAANAALGVLTILFLSRSLHSRASSWAALVALAALLCTAPFLLASSLARNDALAMVLLAAALPPLIKAIASPKAARFALGGALLGLAASAKLNAALPAAGAGLFFLLRVRVYGARALLAFGGGMLVGLLPALIMASIAPDAFRFDVFEYNLEAPVQWWTSISQSAELRPFHRLLKLFGQASLGSVLVGLIAIGCDPGKSEERRLLDLMIGGGLLAAFLPVPALVQYLVPLLPPLFVRFALALDHARPRARNILLVLAALGSIAGLTSSLVVHFAGLELIRSVNYGRKVAALAGGREVATLSSEYIAGNGISLDPRFATGPFLYRTRGRLGQLAEANGHAVVVESLDKSLTSRPPAVIVFGAESAPFLPDFPRGLDQPIVDWGRAHRYRAVKLGGGLQALVAPR